MDAILAAQNHEGKVALLRKLKFEFQMGYSVALPLGEVYASPLTKALAFRFLAMVTFDFLLRKLSMSRRAE